MLASFQVLSLFVIGYPTHFWLHIMSTYTFNYVFASQTFLHWFIKFSLILFEVHLTLHQNAS
jgi:hypothetical protein